MVIQVIRIFLIIKKDINARTSMIRKPEKSAIAFAGPVDIPNSINQFSRVLSMMLNINLKLDFCFGQFAQGCGGHFMSFFMAALYIDLILFSLSWSHFSS